MRRRSRFLTLALALVLGTALTVPAGPEAHAANVNDGFDPGMIITDALFYDGDSMTAGEVQVFLDARVSECKPWLDPDPDDITCLKDYRGTTSAKAADDYCDGYAGGRTQTAAQMIDGIARSCGVSQKALLVTLQKETGLVTHTWPSSWRYDRAMGYACPDSGPGGTANCDEAYYGFFNQMYMAARQFKRYQALPQNYGYRAGRVNVIKYHPDNARQCGTADVYIRNQATAGLYIYTPYVPNKAALAAGFGTGDACSSYGNRNFYAYYSTWFGSPHGVPVDARFESAYAARGGVEALGAALSPAAYVAGNGGGWTQRFENGTLYRNAAGVTAYRKAGSAITSAYASAGGPSGSWGWPLEDGGCYDHGYCVVDFQHESVLYRSGEITVGYPVPEPVMSAWSALGGPTGQAGVPRSFAQQVAANGGGSHQSFDHGTVYVTSGGVATFRGASSAISRAYDGAGGPAGSWGWPLTSGECLDNGYCVVDFQHVSALYRDGRVTLGYPVADPILAAWTDAGGASGAPGIARSFAGTVAGGSTQRFENGAVFAGPSTPATYVDGAVSTAFEAAGGPSGAWGWPLARSVRDGVTVVDFQHARVGIVDGAVVVGHPFADVSDVPASSLYNPHAESIWWMAERGISTGWPGGPLGREYRPLDTAARDAMAVFLHRLERPDFVAPAAPTFVDVPPSNRYYREIEWLAAEGITTGWETAAGRAYRPLSTVSRDAMAAFLYRLAGPTDYVAPASSPFVDVAVDNRFYTEISWLYETGISEGWAVAGGREFRPLRPIARDALAAFLARFDATVDTRG